MTYREDRDADQARIASLEAELTAARKRIDELEGKRSQALVLAGSRDLAPDGRAKTTAAKWLGAPTSLELTRKFAGTLPADQFEDFVEALREHTRDRGRVELMKTSVTWWAGSSDRSIGPFTCVTVSVRDGATTLIVTDKLGQLAGAVFGGIGGGVGGGAAIAPVAVAIAVPVLAPVIILGWLGGTWFGTRAIFKRSVRKRAEALQAVFEFAVAELERRLRG